MDWFLYDRDFLHERVNWKFCGILLSGVFRTQSDIYDGAFLQKLQPLIFSDNI